MADRLSDVLVARITARLADDWRRTGEGDWLRTPRARRRKDEPTTIAGAILGAVFAGSAGQAGPLKSIERLDDAAIGKVEKKLGFKVPGQLRDLIERVGDGNFGPFNGIRRLANWAKDYEKLRAETPAERNREWPPALLPIVYLSGKRICLDRESGAVVLWTKPPRKASEKKWLASFVPLSPSLEDWLERWVDTPTECEGGPEGGWTPPDAEVARRQAVEQDRLERQAAAEEKAKTFAMADHPPLDQALIDRLRARAGDPDRRTEVAALERDAKPVDVDAMSREVEESPGLDPATKAQLGGMARQAGILSRLMGGLGLSMTSVGGSGTVMLAGGRGRLGKPVGDADLARADASLGFALPLPLRQLYSIADGGFGPGDDGLWRLDQLIERYLEYLSGPQGPNDEPWPARYLPLAEADPAVYCLDLANGAVIVHDVQEMDHLGRGQWERSFRRECGSLAEWLDRWLVRPTMKQTLDDGLRAAMRAAASRPASPVTGYPMQLDDPAQQAEAEITFLRHADASLRASFGLPEIGWEDEVRRRHGLI